MGRLIVDKTNVAYTDTAIVTAFLGTANLSTVRWEVVTCATLDIPVCDQTGGWGSPIAGDGGDGAVRNRGIRWLDHIDPAINQTLLLRLKVWNAGEEDLALYDFVFLDYQGGQ